MRSESISRQMVLELGQTVRHLAGVTENCLGWSKTWTHLVARVKWFVCKTGKKDVIRKSWVFPSIGGKLSFPS